MKTVTGLNGKQYKVSDNGTAFHIDTNDEVCRILDEAINSRRRLKIYLGDTKTGKDWNEEHDTIGRIGRSYGETFKIPILIRSKRSLGGPALLDNCIVKIKDATTGNVLFQLPNYHNAYFSIIQCTHLTPEYTHSVMIDHKLYSNHKSLRSAKLLVNKLS